MNQKLRKYLSGILIVIIVVIGIQNWWPYLFYMTKAVAIETLPLEKQGIVLGARQQIGKTLFYDPRYSSLEYPMGDVPIVRGVCTDVVIRSLRNIGVDLQKMVHEDMKAHFEHYPKNWNLKKPDSNIDHRRVPNLDVFMKREGWSLDVSKDAKNYMPGDIVSWKLPNGRDHIGVVSERLTLSGTPLIIHNIGSGAQMENVLFDWTIVGHFRVLGKRIPAKILR